MSLLPLNTCKISTGERVDETVCHVHAAALGRNVILDSIQLGFRLR